MSGYQAIRNNSIHQRLRFLFTDSALYGGALAISKLLSLFTVPILTRIFSTAEYGAIDALTVIGGLFIALVRMGQDTAVARFFYEEEEKEERKQIVSQALITELILCLSVGFTLFTLAEVVVEQYVAVPEYANAFRILVVAFSFEILVQFFQNLLKWTFSRTKFIIVSLGSIVLTIILTLIFVIVFDSGVVGVFYARLIGMAISALLGILFCKDYLIRPSNFVYGWRMIQFGWPYMIVALGSTLLPAVDRVFITNILDLEALGLYAVGYKLAFLLMLPIGAFQTAWGPFSLAIYKETDALETYNKVLVYYTIFIAFAVFCLVAIAEPLIVLLASGRYLTGSVVVLPIAFGLAAESIAWITGIGIDLSKKTYGSALSYFVGLIVAALTIWVLISPLGILGVGYGIMVGRIAQSICYTLFAYWVYPLRFAWKTPGLVLALTIGLAIVIQIFPWTSLAPYLISRLGSLTLLCVVIWQGILSYQERSLIINKVKMLWGTLLHQGASPQ